MHRQFQLCVDTVFRPVYLGLLEVGATGLKVKPWTTPNALRLSFSSSTHTPASHAGPALGGRPGRWSSRAACRDPSPGTTHPLPPSQSPLWVQLLLEISQKQEPSPDRPPSFSQRIIFQLPLCTHHTPTLR